MPKEDTQFKKGVSGNPGGRPRVIGEVRDLARQHTTDALNALVSIVNDGDANPGARVAAANTILDRGYGKAAASVEVKTSPGRDFADFLRSLDDLPNKANSEDDGTIH
jgi:hypothetical protein